MKRFDFPLDIFQLARLSSAFRTKKDIIVLWMNCIKIISTYSRPLDSAIQGHMVLHVDKMSRVFIDMEGKSFSVSFPFAIYEGNDFLEFGSTACPNIDSKITSDILGLVQGNDILNSRTILDFSDPLMDMPGEQDLVWELLRDLMVCDDGYIRIDHDPVNEDGNLHPLHHADVFYSQFSTFKIGLHSKINLDDFHDILNNRTDCRFIG